MRFFPSIDFQGVDSFYDSQLNHISIDVHLAKTYYPKKWKRWVFTALSHELVHWFDIRVRGWDDAVPYYVYLTELRATLLSVRMSRMMKLYEPWIDKDFAYEYAESCAKKLIRYHLSGESWTIDQSGAICLSKGG